MIEAKQTHCGQHKRYGDFFREWEITTDLPEEEVIEWCFTNLYKRRVPPSGEWHANIRTGGEKDGKLKRVRLILRKGSLNQQTDLEGKIREALLGEDHG